MGESSIPRRRTLGNWFLGLAGLLLVCGETIFKPYLGRGLLFVGYWLLCFLFTLMAVAVAALDFFIVRRLARDRQKQLVDDALRKWQQDRGQQGFTLIELLTVVAVIAVLASLLLPALARAKRKSHQAVCLQNQRQIGLAFAIYLDDHEGRFPDRRDLKQSLPGGYRPWNSWPPSDPRAGWAAMTLERSGAAAGVWSCPGARIRPLDEAIQVVQPVAMTTNAPMARYWLWRFDRVQDEVPADNFWGKTEEQAFTDLLASNNAQVGQPSGPSEVELMVDVYFPSTIPSVEEDLKGRAPHTGGRNRLYLDGHAGFARDARLTR